jgi:hypothetical protein
VSAVTYAPATEPFGAGTKYTYVDDKLYIQKDATNRWFQFDYAESTMNGWTTMPVTQGVAVAGDTCFDVTFYDGATEIHYVYMLLNTSTLMFRQMVI